MKTSSKIAIAAAAIGAWLLAKKKGAISGIGGANDHLLPTVSEYSRYLDIAQNKFGISREQARKRYGLYTIGQWKKLLGIGSSAFDIDMDEYLNTVHPLTDETLKWALSHEDKFRYQLLSRLKQDCDYYLGNGGRNGKYLWLVNNPQGVIDLMRALWDSFDEKPEWLTRGEIDKYEELMLSDSDEFFVDSSDGRRTAEFSKGNGGNVVVRLLLHSPSGRTFTEFIWTSQNLKSAINFAKHYWDENGIDYDPSDFNNVEL